MASPHSKFWGGDVSPVPPRFTPLTRLPDPFALTVCLFEKLESIIRRHFAYRLSLSGTGECLDVIDAECNLKQFDGLT